MDLQTQFVNSELSLVSPLTTDSVREQRTESGKSIDERFLY